jgi:pimeloyl-ACP methyl ester carboxylesterase
VPEVRVDDTLEMVYRVDDFTDPWKSADTILLVHGGMKPKELYYGWVPTLSRHLRVIRPYLRGHWGSTPAPEGYHWTISGLVSDLKNFLDALGLDRVHYVGEALGGTLGYNFAYRYPERLKTLTIVNSPGPTLKGHRMSILLDILKKEGLERTVDYLASSHSEETSDIPGLDDWFHDEMKKCPTEATIGYIEAAANLDVNIDSFLPNIQVPTLLLTGAEYSSLITLEEAQHFRELIPRAKLVVFPGVKAVAVVAVPERCAEEVLRFIGEQPPA